MTKSESVAESYRLKREMEINAGIQPMRHGDVADLISRYLEAMPPGTSNAHRGEAERILNGFLRICGRRRANGSDGLKTGQLSPETIDRFITRRQRVQLHDGTKRSKLGRKVLRYKPVSNVTLRKELRYLSGFLNWCCRQRPPYLRENPIPLSNAASVKDDAKPHFMITEDDTYKYTWDGENRLIKIATRVELGADSQDYDDGDKKLEFKYDYVSRRVEKTYSVYSTANGWEVQSGYPQLFVYDGWNVILMMIPGTNYETDRSDVDIERKYTWGLDLSGTIHGAGGVGGLLACEDSGSYYHFLRDANGNVCQVLWLSTLETGRVIRVDGRYQYDPYGNELQPDPGPPPPYDPYDEVNPFRFSTKWLDTELAADSQTVKRRLPGTLNDNYSSLPPNPVVVDFFLFGSFSFFVKSCAFL